MSKSYFPQCQSLCWPRPCPTVNTFMSQLQVAGGMGPQQTPVSDHMPGKWEIVAYDSSWRVGFIVLVFFSFSPLSLSSFLPSPFLLSF
jgi:hypothetical protein